MTKKEPKSLFRRLTKIFRSGPIVKRKIRGIDTTLAMADKTKSSGTLLFQKSLSPTYATITSNAYNLSERLMRYQDFQEMEYSLAISTKIATSDGFKTIGELAEECSNDRNKTFVVYSYDHVNKKIVPALGKQARQTCVDHAWKITFDNGKEITASAEHRLMLRDGSYRRVEDLKPGDAMMPFYRRDLFEGAKEGTKGYSWVYTMDDRFNGWTKEHQLIAEWIAGRKLTDDEVVHHINFNKTDNRPENLKIMTKSDHDSYHTSLNNEKKWAPENSEWIESFKKKHSEWMRDNAPTARHDVTFSRILETAERVGFSMPAISSALDVTWNLIIERLVSNGFANFSQFVDAYAEGQRCTSLSSGKPGLLTRDLSIDLIKSYITEDDTKRSLCIKMGCTVNVLDKYLARRLQTSWSELRCDLGYKNNTATVTTKDKHVRAGGRPKGANGNQITFKHICDAYVSGLTLPRLSEKLGVNKNTVTSRLAQNGFKKYSEFASQYENCKVVSVEYVGVIPLYDLTVDGYKNFATDSVISHNTPEIAAALDIYADETWAQDDKGRALHVHSDNEKIKEVLEDLFYNTLNVEFAGRSWVRNLPVRKGTIIPLLDGRNVPIEQLAAEHESGKENWVYSVQDKTLKTVPGKIAWCGLTRKDSELVRVWLDDETYVDCTPDHEWVLRDGSSCRADELTKGTSLMPLYRTAAMCNGQKGYERVYDAGLHTYFYTHRVMAPYKWKKSDVGKVIHHRNFNRSDNTPTNLQVLTRDEHIELHRNAAQKYNGSELHKQHNVQRRAAMKKLWADPVRAAEVSLNMQIKFDASMVDMIVDRLRKIGKYVSPKTFGTILQNDSEFMTRFYALNENMKRDLSKTLNSHTGFESLLRRAGERSYLELVSTRAPEIADTAWYKRALRKSKNMSGIVPAMRMSLKNHKVDHVERLTETSDVYCMEVLGPDGEHDRHRFGVMTFLRDGSLSKSSIISTNCKYGDFFLYNDVSPEYGVVNAFPVPVNEIEREENYDRDDPFAVRYRWVTLGNRTLENWEVSHFRLLGNDMFLPYGSSIIEPARRIWRQLILIEDAMLVYRVVRAPERRVFYIDVANVPPENVPMYVEEQRRNLRTNQVVDNQSGRVDLRYNPLCFRGDVRVPLLDGRTITIKQLVEEWESGRRDQETYSLDLEQGGRIVPGSVIWAGKSGRASELVRVHLDDGGIIEVTPDHKMMLRDGNPIKASDLRSGDSLMPMHCQYQTMKSKTTCADDRNAYEQVLDPASGCYYFTHRLVLAAKNGLKVYGNGFIAQQGYVIHHHDHDKRNNSQSNLELMRINEHSRYHSDLARVNIIAYNKSDKKRKKTALDNKRFRKAERMGELYNHSVLHASHNEARRRAQKKAWALRHAERSRAMRYVWTEACQQHVVQLIRQLHEFEGLDAFLRRLSCDATFIDMYKGANKHLSRDASKSIHKNVVGRFITNDYKDWRSIWASHHPSALGRRFINNVDATTRAIVGPNNHKVTSIEMIKVDEDVYNVTVDRWHNLTVQASNCTEPNLGKVQSFQSVDEDFFIPVRGSDTGTRIDTLAGGQNTAAVEDVAYIQKKLFAALKIPRAYLGYDELLCLGKDEIIPTLANKQMTVQDLVASFKLGAEHWVYSVDASGNIVPGRVIDAWETKHVTSLHEVELDDGSFVKVTPNHPFMLRDGTYKRADELVAGDSLMPLYRQLSSKIDGDFQNGYEKVWDNNDKRWRFTHRMVAEGTTISKHQSFYDEGKRVVHHIDNDKRNNEPTNLQYMGRTAHALHHSSQAEILCRPESRDKLRIVMKTDKYRQKHLEGVKRGWREASQRRHDLVAENNKKKRSNVSIDDLVIIAKSSRSTTEFYINSQLSQRGVNNIIKRAGLNVKQWLSQHVGRPKGCTFDELIQYCKENNVQTAWHFRKQPLPKQCPINNTQLRKLLTSKGYNRWSKFFSKELCDDKKRHNHKVVAIRELILSSPEPVYDITVEGHHNFALQGHLRCDNSLGGCVFVSNSSKATLAQEDIRFSRTINVIQRTMLAELNKLAIIHLYAHGFDNDDLQNFTLRLSNPSTVAQQQKLELWRAKFEIGGSLPEGMGSTEFVQREIWGLNKEQIDEIHDQQIDEARRRAEVEAAATVSDDEEGGSTTGGDDDLFGSEQPDDDAGGGGEEDLPPEENAGEEPEEDITNKQLLTSADDQDGESFALRVSSSGGDPVVAPIKPKNKVQKDYAYNRSRRRTHGPSKTHMPDFVKMTGIDNDAMNDPTDSEWMKSVISNPLGESPRPRSPFGGMSPDMWSTLRRMQSALKIDHSNVIVEAGDDVQHEIDLGILNEETNEFSRGSKLLIDNDESDG